jgi:thiol-disulfide isomerase/thioredoxin
MTKQNLFLKLKHKSSMMKWLTSVGLFLTLATGCTSQPQIFEEVSSLPSTNAQPALSATNSSKLALAKHLRDTGTNMYGAYWCGYCQKQLSLFGEEAVALLNEIECDPKGKNARPDLCEQANISGFPTWEINGQLYPGLQSLDHLADISGYQGNRNWN